MIKLEELKEGDRKCEYFDWNREKLKNKKKRKGG